MPRRPPCSYPLPHGLPSAARPRSQTCPAPTRSCTAHRPPRAHAARRRRKSYTPATAASAARPAARRFPQSRKGRPQLPHARAAILLRIPTTVADFAPTPPTMARNGSLPTPAERPAANARQTPADKRPRAVPSLTPPQPQTPQTPVHSAIRPQSHYPSRPRTRRRHPPPSSPAPLHCPDIVPLERKDDGEVACPAD
jgi:hypothetical protein